MIASSVDGPPSPHLREARTPPAGRDDKPPWFIVAMRGPGRPELPEGEARTVKVTVYVRPQDEALMSRVAEATGKKLSGWAYEVLLRAAQAESRRHRIDPATPPPPRGPKRKPGA